MRNCGRLVVSTYDPGTLRSGWALGNLAQRARTRPCMHPAQRRTGDLIGTPHITWQSGGRCGGAGPASAGTAEVGLRARIFAGTREGRVARTLEKAVFRRSAAISIATTSIMACTSCAIAWHCDCAIAIVPLRLCDCVALRTGCRLRMSCIRLWPCGFFVFGRGATMHNVRACCVE